MRSFDVAGCLSATWYSFTKSTRVDSGSWLSDSATIYKFQWWWELDICMVNVKFCHDFTVVLEIPDWSVNSMLTQLWKMCISISALLKLDQSNAKGKCHSIESDFMKLCHLRMIECTGIDMKCCVVECMNVSSWEVEGLESLSFPGLKQWKLFGWGLHFSCFNSVVFHLSVMLVCFLDLWLWGCEFRSRRAPILLEKSFQMLYRHSG